MNLGDFLNFFFWWHKGTGVPADQKPHDTRDDETVDSSTGIAIEDGQIVNNTSIDANTQDKEKGFPK